MEACEGTIGGFEVLSEDLGEGYSSGALRLQRSNGTPRTRCSSAGRSGCCVARERARVCSAARRTFSSWDEAHPA